MAKIIINKYKEILIVVDSLKIDYNKFIKLWFIQTINS
jgi:hypothetical protein